MTIWNVIVLVSLSRHSIHFLINREEQKFEFNVLFFLFHSLLILIIIFTSIKSRTSWFLPQHWNHIQVSTAVMWLVKISLFCHMLVHQGYERNLCKWPRMFNLFKKTEIDLLHFSFSTHTYCKPIYFQLIHTCVVDTSIVFPHRRGPPLKRALRNLTSELLQRIIQEDGM